MGTRKRNKGESFIFSDSQGEQEEMDIREEGGDKFENVGVDQDQESDDDFVVVKKKARGRPRKIDSKPKKVKTSRKLKKVLDSKTSLNSLGDGLKTQNTQVDNAVYADSKSKPTDYNCNLNNDEKPVTIATPEQINSRSFDQEEFLTPNSIPMEEMKEGDSCDKIVSRMASAVARSLKFLPPASSSSAPPCESQVTTSVPFLLHPSQQVLSEVTTSLTDQSEDKPAPPISQTPINKVPAAGRGRRPAQPHRPGLVRQSVPSTRPNLTPSASRMLRPLRPRPGLPRNTPMAGGPYRPGSFRPRAPLTSAGLRLTNIRSITPVKHRSLSSSQYSSQHPVVEIDVSPPRSYQASQPSPPSSSVVDKLSSLGVSVAREKVPPTKHGWVLPPGLSVTKTSSSTEEGPSLSLPSLATALLQLGEVGGRKRLVQFKLTEVQVRALDALGVREEDK